MKNKVQFYQMPCKRCGKIITTTTKSILGLDNLHKEYSGICHDCLTDDEQNTMLNLMGQQIIKK